MRRTAGFILIAFLGAAAMAQAPPPTAAQKPPPMGCTNPESRQFDFWVGKWDVYPTGKDKLVAHSLIERLYGGCAIRENWMPLVSPGGGSLSSWVAADKGWRQTWVDSSGARVDFKGEAIKTAMVLQGFWPGSAPDGKDGIVRMTYTAEAGGSVRQLGQVSTDKGRTWQPSFDFTYKPAKS